MDKNADEVPCKHDVIDFDIGGLKFQLRPWPKEVGKYEIWIQYTDGEFYNLEYWTGAKGIDSTLERYGEENGMVRIKHALTTYITMAEPAFKTLSEIAEKQGHAASKEQISSVIKEAYANRFGRQS